MQLKQLSLINFKNYEEATLSFSNHINCFIGNNGEGKTNLLDAIYYLSFSKSFFNPIDSQNILHDSPFFVIQGLYDLEGEAEEIYCGQKRNQKKQLKRNKKEYTKLADHIGLLPLVMISPSDSELILDGSESRRRFIDMVITQYDREYLDTLMAYNKVLAHRNALLKQFTKSGNTDAVSLELWNNQLVHYGSIIHKKREGFISQFIPIFQYYYEVISGGNEPVNLVYHSQLTNQSFEVLLTNNFKRDLALEYTTVGVHKDDLDFLISSYPIKKYGSQGQQKSYLIALKLAQYDFIKKIKGIKPLLLLDDIYDKLDDHRIKKLMKMVSSNNFGQLFITDTHLTRLKELFQAEQVEFKLFNIHNGTIHL